MNEQALREDISRHTSRLRFTCEIDCMPLANLAKRTENLLEKDHIQLFLLISNGTILISSPLESPTYNVKLKKLF